MSRFTDFDDYLRSERATQDATQSQKKQQLIEVRKKHDDLIRSLFQSLKEYHETVILPRNDSILILKRQELESDSLSFIYRANLIPTDFLPPAFRATDIVQRVDYLNPQEITSNDWHANVALQVSLHVTLHETSAEPSIEIMSKTWGQLNADENKLLPTGITMSQEEDKRKLFTTTVLKITDQPVTEAVTTIENLLLLLTPSVLDHRNVVWNK